MSSVSLYSWLKTYLNIFSKNTIDLFYNLEFRDYISALTLAFTLWNYWNTEKKFAALNYPILKAELELPTFRKQDKLFPIYPNYKVTNISEKKAVDIKIEVKIYSLKRKYKIWQSCWLDRSTTKFDNLEPKAELKFKNREYFDEFLIFKGRLFDQRDIKEYFVYQNLLPKLELKEMMMYRTHYWKLQEIEKSWQFPFKLF